MCQTRNGRKLMKSEFVEICEETVDFFKIIYDVYLEEVRETKRKISQKHNFGLFSLKVTVFCFLNFWNYLFS
jgi:hypothetical protein